MWIRLRDWIATLSPLNSSPLSPRRRAPRRLSMGTTFDRLEPRYLLSGNVQAFFVNDLLWVVGDDASNQVILGRAEGDVRLIGQHGTTINGASSFLLQSASNQFNRSIFVTLHGGQDTFIIQDGLRLGGSVTIFSGSGNDLLALEDVRIDGHFSVATGSGQNRLAVQDVRVGGNLYLEGGSGDDTFHLNRLEVLGGGRIKTDQGHDILEIIDSSIAHFASIEMNSGDDTFILEGSQFSGGLHVSLGRGHDVMTLRGENQVSGLAIINAQRGNDWVHFETGASLPARLQIDGGKGTNATNVIPLNVDGLQRTTQNIQQVSTDAAIGALLADPGRRVNDRLEATRGLVSQAPPIPAMTLTVQVDANHVVASGGLQVTGRESIDLTGTTRPGAVIELARDGDSVFDDGTVTADADGSFAITVDSLLPSLEHGLNTIVVRATDDLGRQLIRTLSVYRAEGTVVRMDSVFGPIDFELYDQAAPQTVANFLNYQDRYVNSIVHRSAKSGGNDFVIQGGGFRLNAGDELVAIATDAPVPSEASLDRSNVRGTLAMALQGGDPDSGTSQWFINMADNEFLDAQSFTVFGQVIGNGLEVADQIHALNRFLLADLLDQPALTDVPLRNYINFSGVMIGAVSANVGSDLITGIGTSFTTDVPADRLIRIGTDTYFVSEVLSDSELRIATPATVTVTNVSAFINRIPNKTQYILMNQIAEFEVPR